MDNSRWCDAQFSHQVNRRGRDVTEPITETVFWECGSWQNEYRHFGQQSLKCRIRELEAEVARLQWDHKAMELVRRHAPVAFGRTDNGFWAGIGDGPVYDDDPARAIIKAAEAAGGE
jgi:hypothetical protein